MPAGRPSEYTKELADAMCARLADGESLRAVCRDEGMPDKTTVFKWLREHAEFLIQYDRAKEESADSHADDLKDIADDGRNDFIVTEDGKHVLNAEHIQRSRLRVDTRKWIASKLKPKKYGDKIEHEHSGKISLDALVNGSLPGRDKTGV